MPGNPDRPFDHDTLKLRAVFAPEDAKSGISKADIIGPLGHDAVKIPAVFVPEGGTPPGYPYQRFGQTVFRPDEDDSEDDGPTMARSSPDAAENDSEPPAGLPRTRYRFGAALLRGRNPGPPPNPSLVGGQGDTLAAGIAALRAMAKPGNPLRQSLAVPGPGLDDPRGVAANVASGGAAAAASSGGGEGPRDAALRVRQAMPRTDVTPGS